MQINFLLKSAMDITIVLFTLLISLASCAGGTSPVPTCDFPAIYNFGDSNSDTGGISAAFWPIPPPYGVSYFKRPAGRSSDGRLIIDFIAEHLRLPYLSPYLDSIGANFRNGANFATGGSTIRRQNESIFENGISPFSLDVQIQQFYQFISRTSQLYDQATNPYKNNKLPRPSEFSKALYTFDIGQNDVITGLRKLKMAQIQAVIPDIVNQFANAITRLYQLGARAFWIHNMRPTGCFPAAGFHVENTKTGLRDEFGCVRTHNDMAVEFNRRLKARVRTLRAQLSHAAITYVDIYSVNYHLIKNAKLYGFREPMKICCGKHENNVYLWCGQKQVINGTEIVGAACSSPATCISWDGMHFSQAANQWIANHILDGSFSDPQKPISQACFKR